MYLSPVSDMFNGEIVSYKVSSGPSMAMVTDMPKDALGRLGRRTAQSSIRTKAGSLRQSGKTRRDQWGLASVAVPLAGKPNLERDRFAYSMVAGPCKSSLATIGNLFLTEKSTFQLSSSNSSSAVSTFKLTTTGTPSESLNHPSESVRP